MGTLTRALLLPFPGYKTVAMSSPSLVMSKVSSSLAFFVHVHDSNQFTSLTHHGWVREWP